MPAKIGLTKSIYAPPSLLVFSSLVFIASTLIPAGLYSLVMNEPDYMYLNVPLYGFFFIHALAYLAGFVYFSRGSSKLTARRRVESFKNLGINCLFFLLVFEIVLIAYQTYQLFEGISGLLYNLLNSSVQSTKLSLQNSTVAVSFGGITQFSTCTVWWMTYRWSKIMASMNSRITKLLFFALLSTVILIIMINCVLIASRFHIIILLFGTFISFSVSKLNRQRYSGAIRKRSVKNVFYLFIFGILAVALFTFFAYIRGAGTTYLLLYQLMGYGPASYNRLADIVTGNLPYYYPGAILSEFRFILQFPFETKFLPVSNDYVYSVANRILSYSNLVGFAGLDPNFMWAGVLGSVFGNFGYFGILYLFFLGAVAGFAWKSILRDEMFGILFYPWVAFSLFMWFADDFFGTDVLPYLIILVFLLGFFERRFGKFSAPAPA